MSFLNYSACATCHGPSSEDLFAGLLKPSSVLSKGPQDISAFKLKNLHLSSSYLSNIEQHLEPLISPLEESFSSHKSESWGLILASTKGVIEDFIWQDSVSCELDPYQPLLSRLEQKLPFTISKSTTVSNACASSHGALELGQKWLKRNKVDHVVIVAADLIGPFIHKGFSSLRALSEKQVCRPFDKYRDGLLLGDGLGIAVISRKALNNESLILESVYNLCESFSVTRPDTSGETLSHCFKQSVTNTLPDAMIAHGTATYYNDMTEANAISSCFKEKKPPLITATKWSVGHSLGASGLIDLSAACEMLKQQTLPAIHTLQESEFNIHEWLVKENKETTVNSVLVSSLGFGGICSSFIVRKGEL